MSLSSLLGEHAHILFFTSTRVNYYINIFLFRYGTRNGEDCGSYTRMKLRKWFGDAASRIEDCDHDASWIGDFDLKLVSPISSTVDPKEGCLYD